jgi:E3 ubiquitin-protein ligase synoviolin
MIFDQARYAFTETCLALTMFREELNARVIALFAALLCVKCFHWLAQHRVDAVARLEGM